MRGQSIEHGRHRAKPQFGQGPNSPAAVKPTAGVGMVGLQAIDQDADSKGRRERQLVRCGDLAENFGRSKSNETCGGSS